MRVAFATSDGERVDGELRGARRVDVYEVTRSEARLQRTERFEEAALGGSARIRAIAGAELLFVAAVGTSDAVRLALHGIRAVPEVSRPRVDTLVLLLQRRLDALGRDGLAAVTAG